MKDVELSEDMPEDLTVADERCDDDVSFLALMNLDR